jgi:acyl transferase domain-containing protein
MAQSPDRYDFPASEESLTGSEIAIIGMTCRFPGADTVEELWRHLCQGDELLSLLTDDELRAAGVPEEVFRNANFVRRSPVVDRMEYFDAEFFGYTPLEARIMDPQHRLFLECSWAGLERAGYDPATYPGQIGVFTGAKTNTYLFNLFQNRELFSSLDTFQIALGNDLACMATRVSFKLGLTGPSYAVHTACSTSLVAVHLACQSLLIDECQMALAGGAAINVPQRRGYLYQPGGIVSPDGSCRTFDADARGSNFGNGAGAVVLKRLEDALADGDHIHAVIKGSATNNDGAAKASFTAPGVRGQSAVILEALACAGVDAETISYIEAHGTATDLGDCIEMLALTDAFRASTSRKGFCAIGSVKTNLGHLETAAGVAGLIKTSLALEHRVLPPSLHFKAPNPKIDFENSPFFVNTELQPWSSTGDHPLRAGLSSFGIGSTNAHAILEEAPRPAAHRPARPAQLVLLSARSESALATASENLAAAFEAQPPPDLADAAYTLQVGRRRFDVRRALVCRDHEQAVQALRGAKAPGSVTRTDDRTERPVAFLLPGLGDQRLNIARGLYDTEEVFREALDRCCRSLEPLLGVDLRQVLYPEAEEGTAETAETPKKPDLKSFLSRGGGPVDPREERLRRTLYAQPALFVVEYALARLWMSWGIEPQALLGYSLGEYVAACLSGVLELEDALTLVAERSRLIEELPAGAMVGVSLPVDEVEPLLGQELAVAAVNGPNLCVVSGPAEAVARLEAELEERSVASRRLATSHAFHSPMMEPVAERLRQLAAGFRLSAPRIPYLSNVTGTWIRPEEATDPDYWASHLVATVRFEEGARLLLERGDLALLEMGTGQSLCSFLRLHPACDAQRGQLVLPSLPGALDSTDDDLFTVSTLGRLWAAGVDPDWQAFHRGEQRLRVPLPTYPFEGKYHWVEPDGAAAPRASAPARVKHPDPGIGSTVLPGRTRRWARPPQPASSTPGLG